jgi:hypothetical protein
VVNFRSDYDEYLTRTTGNGNQGERGVGSSGGKDSKPMTNVMSISRWEALKRGDVSRTEDGEARNRAYIQWRQTGANHFSKETQDRIKTEQQAKLNPKQMLRNQRAAEKSGKTLQDLYLTGSVKKETNPTP